MGLQGWGENSEQGESFQEKTVLVILIVVPVTQEKKKCQNPPNCVAVDWFLLPLDRPLWLFNVTVLRRTPHRCRTSVLIGQDRCPLSTFKGSNAFCKYENTLTEERAARTLQDCKR